LFTGIIQQQGQLMNFVENSAGAFLSFKVSNQFAENIKIGDSIATNGCCLSVIEMTTVEDGVSLSFDLSNETIERCSFNQKQDFFNLEKALKMGDRMDGHMVSGHVDGFALVDSIKTEDEFTLMNFKLAQEQQKKIAPFLVEKGSVAIHGVSLTVNHVEDLGEATFFGVSLIPITLKETNLGQLSVGSQVNVEADLMAKYFIRYKNFNNMG